MIAGAVASAGQTIHVAVVVATATCATRRRKGNALNFHAGNLKTTTTTATMIARRSRERGSESERGRVEGVEGRQHDELCVGEAVKSLHRRTTSSVR